MKLSGTTKTTFGNKKHIVGIGEVLWDMLPSGRRAGGAPANFAYFASQLGHDGIIVSAVGNDHAGHDLLKCIIDSGLTSKVMISCCYPTGKVDIDVDDKGVPTYSILNDTAYDYIFYTKDIDRMAVSADAVCFGTLAQRSAASRATIRHFLDRTSPECIRVFDVNFREHFYSREVVEESLKLCDILKINADEEEEIKRLIGISADEIFEKYGLTHLIVTYGENGSRVKDISGESRLPTPKVDVVDTVGAGDSFTAAFVVALLEGHTTAEAHHFAADFSAQTCTRAGAISVSKASK